MKCCVYVRMLNEEPYIDFFTKYYLKLGFDRIFVLKSSKTPYTDLDKRVCIHTVLNTGNKLLRRNDHLIKASECDWVLAIDADEFLVLGRQYKTIQEYVRDQLDRDKSINVFQFRWLMIERMDNDNLSFADTVNTYNSYPNRHVKSMTKVPDIRCLRHPHYPDLNKGPVVFFENECLSSVRPHHKRTRRSYADAALIHIHTRSIDDLLLKAASTVLGGKSLASVPAFRTAISMPCNLEDFQHAVGAKARLPFEHSTSFSLDLANPVSMERFNILQLEEVFVNKDVADAILQKILLERGIDYNQYRLYVEELIKHINGKYAVKKPPADRNL